MATDPFLRLGFGVASTGIVQPQDVGCKLNGLNGLASRGMVIIRIYLIDRCRWSCPHSADSLEPGRELEIAGHDPLSSRT